MFDIERKAFAELSWQVKEFSVLKIFRKVIFTGA